MKLDIKISNISDLYFVCEDYISNEIKGVNDAK